MKNNKRLTAPMLAELCDVINNKLAIIMAVGSVLEQTSHDSQKTNVSKILKASEKIRDYVKTLNIYTCDNCSCSKTGPTNEISHDSK